MFVDYHLRPYVEPLPSYLRDTTHFLTRVQGLDTLPLGTLLVTLDVKSLYTNIPHDDGIEACREALNTRTQLQPPTEDLVELIKQILTKNTFIFAGQHYLQTHGTAMGTRMAPSYTNLFMGRLESRILAEAERKPDVCLVALHRRCLRHLDPWRKPLEGVPAANQPSPFHDQVHSRMVP